MNVLRFTHSPESRLDANGDKIASLADRKQHFIKLTEGYTSRLKKEQTNMTNEDRQINNAYQSSPIIFMREKKILEKLRIKERILLSARKRK
ncbi:Mediator of RNA polymerase II transcription subunit [Dirofilaria immitis]